MPEPDVRLGRNRRLVELKTTRGNPKVGLRNVDGGVTAARGFVAGSTWCGIKPGPGKKDDLALIYSTLPCHAAATFTTNKVKAAPVEVSQAHLASTRIQAIVANSGNANACTGPLGLVNARLMTRAVAGALGIRAREVLVCSTGRIGVDLPIERIANGIGRFPQALSSEGSLAAARAIMTSDTFPKEAAVELSLGNRRIRIGGIAKGAGMIDPTMATMLCFVTTDARVGRRDLQSALRSAVEQSFNRITVDGDMSTNDTAIILANGAADHPRLAKGQPGWTLFQKGLDHVLLRLAQMIVRDGEGVTKFVTIHVKHAVSAADGRKAANAVAKSCLAKCAWFGGDPNWGRIMAALGYAKINFRPERVKIAYDGVTAVRNGRAVKNSPLGQLASVAAQEKFTITIDLSLGVEEYMVYTTDLSTRYVELNMGE